MWRKFYAPDLTGFGRSASQCSAVQVAPRFRKPDPVRVELLSDGLHAVSIASRRTTPRSRSATRARTWAGSQSVRSVSICLFEMKRDCRMAGRACTEGAGQLSVRVWGRWGRPKHRPAIIRSVAAA